MGNNKFSEMSKEELIKNQKTLTGVAYGLGIVLFLAFVVNIFLVFKKGFSALTVVPIALLPVLILNISNLKEIKKELESRDN
jgi:tetrahydromethanopterin S-methyltransferase subunit E